MNEPIFCLVSHDEVISYIIKDIKRCKGLGEAWEKTDVDVRNEIVSNWRGIFINCNIPR